MIRSDSGGFAAPSQGPQRCGTPPLTPPPLSPPLAASPHVLPACPLVPVCAMSGSSVGRSAHALPYFVVPPLLVAPFLPRAMFRMAQRNMQPRDLSATQPHSALPCAASRARALRLLSDSGVRDVVTPSALISSLMLLFRLMSLRFEVSGGLRGVFLSDST